MTLLLPPADEPVPITAPGVDHPTLRPIFRKRNARHLRLQLIQKFSQSISSIGTDVPIQVLAHLFPFSNQQRNVVLKL